MLIIKVKEIGIKERYSNQLFYSKFKLIMS